MMYIPQAHRGFLAFERTGKFEVSSAFSIAELRGNQFQPGIWAGHSASVEDMMKPHKQHRFGAIITAASLYLSSSNIDRTKEETYVGGSAVVLMPSSPISYGPGEFEDDQ